MRKTPLQRVPYVLGILAALVPFAFALIRAITTGSDLRYLWMAFAAVVGVVAVAVTGKARRQTRTETLQRSAAVCVLATLLAACAGYLLGARSSVGVGIVAVAFGMCEAAGFALTKFSRSHNEAPNA